MYTYNDILEARLLRKRRIDSNGCWIWTSTVDADGYGVIGYFGNNTRCHVLAAKLWFPKFNSELMTLHKCDIRRCFNPEHLYQGTAKDNANDAVIRGRHWEASKTHCNKGHEFTSTNTYYWNNHRYCKLCKKLRRQKVEN